MPDTARYASPPLRTALAAPLKLPGPSPAVTHRRAKSAPMMGADAPCSALKGAEERSGMEKGVQDKGSRDAQETSS